MTELSINAVSLSISAFYLQNQQSQAGQNTVGQTDPMSSTPVAAPTAPVITQAGDTDGDNDGSGSSNASGSAASVSFSGPAKMFSQLQQLQRDNPADFQQLMSGIASQLQQAAKQATGSDQQFLTALADRFQQAAGGDLAALNPAQQSQIASMTAATTGSTSLQGAAAAGSGAAAATQTGPLAVNSQPTDPVSPRQNGTVRHHVHRGGRGGGADQKALSAIFNELSQALSNLQSGVSAFNTGGAAGAGSTGASSSVASRASGGAGDADDSATGGLSIQG